MTTPTPHESLVPRLTEVRERHVPAWIKAIPAPPSPDLCVVLTRARHEAIWYGLDGWRDWFIALADALLERIGEPPYAGPRLDDLLTVLDLAPGLLSHGDDFLEPRVHQCLQRGVAEIFVYRQYPQVDALRKRLGKPTTTSDLAIYRLWEAARTAYGMTEERAVEYAREAFPEVSPDGIRSAVRRARKGSFVHHLTVEPTEADHAARHPSAPCTATEAEKAGK